ncbi:MAG: aminotransferase class I/II-fold pyridoxal phosphate-dependent enzyme [Acidobacteria bacterium]|nr:aminotransferase class I/II-fold pyridoxal phosphate-dependent enzyme [Acidobacteriota bacterium]
MSLSRRNFVRTVGLGGAGLSTALIIGRGREALAFEGPAVQALQPPDDGLIHIDSNENARGPGQSSIDALHRAISSRVGRGYPPDYVRDFGTVVATRYGVDAGHVIIGTGSGPILEAAVRAFCSPTKPLVTGSPSYSSPEGAARRIGAEIRALPVDRELKLDLDAMAQAASGAGLVFLCNPNNPTATAHKLTSVEQFVRRVKQDSPDTAILIDEAYIDYVYDPAVKTAIPLTQEFPGVFVARTFSKAHGMAGLRLGYSVGQPATVRAVAQAWSLDSMNTLTAAAGITSFRDTAHIDEDRQENARIRDFTLQAFRKMGFEASDCQTNHLFVDLGRPASEFRNGCRELGVAVGRDFPPMEKTHSRISLGTMEEMRKAVGVFQKVLGKATNV